MASRADSVDFFDFLLRRVTGTADAGYGPYVPVRALSRTGIYLSPLRSRTALLHGSLRTHIAPREPARSRPTLPAYPPRTLCPCGPRPSPPSPPPNRDASGFTWPPCE